MDIEWTEEERRIISDYKDEINQALTFDSSVDIFNKIKIDLKGRSNFFDIPQSFYKIALTFFYYKYGPGNMDLIFIRMAERRVGVRICVYGGNNVQLTIYQFYRDLLDNYNFSKAPFPSLQLKKDVRDLVLLEVATDNIYVGDIYELTDELLAIVARANYKYI